MQLFKDPAPAGGKKVEWKEVINAADGVAKQATTSKYSQLVLITWCLWVPISRSCDRFLLMKL
jgi:hypothetical protein